MKLIIKQIIYTLISVLKFLIRANFKERFKLKSDTKKENCVILGNGPSLTSIIELLHNSDNQVFFAVNFFVLSDHFFRLKPNYYVFADSAFWDKEEKMNPETIIQRRELISRFLKIDWNMTIYIPYSGGSSYVIENMIASNHNLQVKFYNTCSFKGFRKIREWTYKQNFCMPISQNVLISSIYLAINSGYKIIEVYGGDFSWTESLRVNENNVVCQIDNHFYDKTEVKLSPVLAYVDRPWRMHNILGDYAKMFEGCWECREYSDSQGVRIINKNKDSFIDAFEKG